MSIKKPYQPIAWVTRQKIQELKKYMEQKRYSHATVRAYISFVNQFFAQSRLAWNALTLDVITAYNHSQFIKTGKSYSAQNQWINAIKLYIYVHKLQLALENIERPRREKLLPNVLTRDEVRKIFQSTPNLKHRTLLMLIYSCGLRIGEALALRMEDIRSDEGLIYIRRAKGKKDRRVPLSRVILKELRVYYLAYKPRHYLFEGQKGGPYSIRSAAAVMKRSAKRAGIKGRVTLHTLRHSYATHLTNRGVNIQYLQEILGHNSPRTTMIYTHISGKDIRDIKSPLDEMDL